MPRRSLLNILMALSLLLFAAVAALWVVGNTAGGVGFEFQWLGSRWEARANHSEMWLSNEPQRLRELKQEEEERFRQFMEDQRRRASFEREMEKQTEDLPKPEAQVRRELALTRFDADSVAAESRLHQSQMSRRSPRKFRAMPIWFALAVTAAFPAYSGFQLARRHGRGRACLAAGLCPSCGYDLRATSDRCPECGARPARYRQ